MKGKIIKGIAGFYYVHDGRSKIYECKAKGVFRNRNIKPLVGDDVEFMVLDEKEGTGNIDAILPRKNKLIRPAVSNVDQAVVVFAVTEPLPNLNLLDRFLVSRQSPTFCSRRPGWKPVLSVKRLKEESILRDIRSFSLWRTEPI